MAPASRASPASPASRASRGQARQTTRANPAAGCTNARGPLGIRTGTRRDRRRCAGQSQTRLRSFLYRLLGLVLLALARLLLPDRPTQQLLVCALRQTLSLGRIERAVLFLADHRKCERLVAPARPATQLCLH